MKRRTKLQFIDDALDALMRPELVCRALGLCRTRQATRKTYS
ncbi:hypothetical protein [Pyrobaculum ferrireducens]|uniref:Uncharacterized protein n=1 Tax=Pyrobaculum ferrireducens TaxID=1104324 RepID=G7VEG5_9CREN|nr:hypothetical protein [Pyrobaculum ferrireducens]AET31589.1 hypothetical protein P186_0121 [Pyrobaculum ferrireducens]